MKKILLTLVILTIALSISLSLIACDNTNNDDNKGNVTYTITINCNDVVLLDTVSVKLLDSNGNAVTESVYLDKDHKATFSLKPSVYKVAVEGPLSDYEDIEETLVTPTSLNAIVMLTKKGVIHNDKDKVIYKITLTMPSGEPVANETVQLCTSAEAGGLCHTEQTDANGVATFDLSPDNYEVHVLKCPDGYTFDDKEYKVTAEQREITVQYKAISE